MGGMSADLNELKGTVKKVTNQMKQQGQDNSSVKFINDE